MFRSDAQLARACRVLCEGVRLEGMWTEAGPSETAIALMEADGGPLSSGERIRAAGGVGGVEQPRRRSLR